MVSVVKKKGTIMPSLDVIALVHSRLDGEDWKRCDGRPALVVEFSLWTSLLSACRWDIHAMDACLQHECPNDAVMVSLGVGCVH